MVRRRLAILALVITSPAIVLADGPSAEDVAFFESRIRPLFVKQCGECHSPDGKGIKGGLRLDRADVFRKGGDSGEVVVLGEPDESLLIQAVRYDDPDLQMPPAGRMSAREIADLEEWVSRGAPFPDSPASAQDAGGRTIDIAQGRQHWAFRPLQRTKPASLKDTTWPLREIDSYILARLESRGLSPSDRANRRTLIRRVSFDLLGLPPAPEDIAAFEADNSPDAWPELIDRMLASPHYGERWGRHWLDLVRYCDVPESWAKSDARAWLYRDWVVQALNEDLPYDQFVIRQLAADQLPDFQPKDVAALGFLGLSPSYWKELKLAPDVIKTVVAEEWEERITAVTGTVLALTVGCARCHDHKFDPITQKDYYGLAGIFASIRQVPLPMLPQDEARAVVEAHVEVKQLQAEAELLKALVARESRLAKDAKSDQAKAEEARQRADEASRKANAAAARIAVLKAMSQYSAPLVYGIDDAALLVLPDGPNRTKLEYQVGMAQNVAMQVRGNPARTSDVIHRRYLAVLSPGEPVEFTQGSGRREFAEAMFRDSAPLAARVIVNRVWRHHFGRGLVETPSNFGTQAAPPTHPELLDDLAARFIDAGWSLKWLHREILLSATWQQSSETTAALAAIDPDNVLLGRMTRRRLEVEPWRDAMLSSAGRLDLSLGGPPHELSGAGHNRRTIYSTITRRVLPDLLRLYDFPDPTGHSPARLETTTPLQQLFVLNSQFIGEVAKSLAYRLRAASGDQDTQIHLAYSLLYGRSGTPTELSLAREFLGNSPDSQAWGEYVEVLLSRDELIFVD